MNPPIGEKRHLRSLYDLAVESSPHYPRSLGHYTQPQNVYSLSLFQDHGLVLWQSVIDPSWTALLEFENDDGWSRSPTITFTLARSTPNYASISLPVVLP